jgi:tetratricopeptide (TPR) repeat protein
MIAAFVTLLLGFQVQVSPELKQHVETGLKAKQAGDLDTAIREFKRAVDLAPGLAAAHVNLGAVYLAKQDYENAIPVLRRALQINPNLPGASGMLGTALLAEGYAAESIPHLEKGQVDDLLGVALLEAGRPRDAIDKLEAALEKRKDDPDLLYYLGLAHQRLSKTVFDKLANEYPDSLRTHQLLGEANAAAGARDVAEREFRAALAERPTLRGVHYALGELYLGSGDYARAEREFRDEIRLSPGSAEAASKLGFVLLNRGDVASALQELGRANALQPDVPETLLELGKAHLAGGNLPAAEKLFRQVLAREQTSSLAEAAHFQLSQLYRKQGRKADAERETEAFQKLRKR